MGEPERYFVGGALLILLVIFKFWYAGLKLKREEQWARDRKQKEKHDRRQQEKQKRRERAAVNQVKGRKQ